MTEATGRATTDRLALVSACLSVLGPFDDEFYVNVPYYIVGVELAMHALHGGIAMVDVYSIRQANGTAGRCRAR